MASRDKMLFYESIAEEFDKKMNFLETKRRLQIVFDDLLVDEPIKGSHFLDAGAGTGWFSKVAFEKGAQVTSLEIGERLLAVIAQKCASQLRVGSVLDLPFADNTFDYVLNTEVIEHTTDPQKAVSELCRVLKPGGTLVLTVPCKTWKFAVIIANLLKLRPYEGHENWVGYFQLKKWLNTCNMEIERYFGFNCIPIINRYTLPLLNATDKLGDKLGLLMVNIGVKATKK